MYKTSFIGILALSFLLASCSGYNLVGSTNGNVARPVGWSDTTHGNSSVPDYNIVFPQNKVNRLDITISATDWKLMQENMKKLFGEPGSRGNGPGGANQGLNIPIPGQDKGLTLPQPSGIPFPMRTPPDDGIPGGLGAEGPGRGESIQFAEDDPIYKPATVKFEGKTWNNVGIRYKGNSSLKSSWGRTQKLPFRLDFDEFEDTNPAIKNQRFYGFKNLSLSSGFSDNSLIREKIVPDIFRAAGVPAGKTSFYRIYIDHGEGSKYFGMYTMVEVPDTPMFQTQFKKTDGNLYKPDGTGARFGTFDEKSFPKKTNETTSNWNDIKSVFTALHADRKDSAKWRTGLEKVFDIKGYLKYQAVNTVIQNWDSYGAMPHNYYLYTDPSDGLVHWIPWDHNMAMTANIGGGGAFGIPGDINFMLPPVNGSTNPVVQPSVSPLPIPSRTPRPNQQGDILKDGPGGMQGPGGRGNTTLGMAEVGDTWPLIRFLMDDPVYYAQYVSFVDKTIKGAFAPEITKQKFQKEHDLIKQYVVGSEGEQAGYTLLSNTQAFENSVTELIKHLESRQTEANKFVAEYNAKK